jgi:hypothetical protein
MIIALAIVVMASALAMAFEYAQLPGHANETRIALTIDANGNGVVRIR